MTRQAVPVLLTFSFAAHVTAVPLAPAAPAFDVIHYTLSLTPDIARRAVSGVEVIVLTSLRDSLDAVAFSPNALVIDSATVDGEALQAVSTDSALSFVLAHPASRGESLSLRIVYHGVPRRGVIFAGTSAYSTYFACDWMVCTQDEPGDKATFALDLHLPAGLVSLGPGTLMGVRPQVDGTEKHRWRETRPCSAYLFGFAFGDFVSLQSLEAGANLTFLSDSASAPLVKHIVGQTHEMVEFLSSKAGLPLPDNGKYTQLLVSGDEAQEVATWSVIGADNVTPMLRDPQDDWVIVHEMAHQWWGNLVTCATWQDFWLNEGIATYMTAAWKQARFGEAAYQAELDVARARVSRARAQGWDRPLTFAGPYPSLGARRAVQYSKGALFMEHLRILLGDDAFWSGLKAYTVEHAGGVVTSIDLQRAMEHASHRDLSAAFREWVY